jgi:hypothetical protein
MKLAVSGLISVFGAAVVLCVVASAPCLAQSTSGRQGGASMTTHQKAALLRHAKRRMAHCRREANRSKLHFVARRTFLKDCMLRK